MRYNRILSDGDSKTLTTLNKLKPYGSDVVIEKVDCINHVHKRLDTGLQNFVENFFPCKKRSWRPN